MAGTRTHRKKRPDPMQMHSASAGSENMTDITMDVLTCWVKVMWSEHWSPLSNFAGNLLEKRKKRKEAHDPDDLSQILTDSVTEDPSNELKVALNQNPVVVWLTPFRGAHWLAQSWPSGTQPFA